MDWPFRVSEAEQRIIELQSPSSIILLGRSGTGKTTCAVFRMWSRWYTSNASSSAEPFHQARCYCAYLCKFMLCMCRICLTCNVILRSNPVFDTHCLLLYHVWLLELVLVDMLWVGDRS